MATTILTSFEDGPILTSALYSVKARTDKPKVRVGLVRDPDGEMDSFFSTTLYAYDGIVELSDVGSLIEERFRATGTIWSMMEILFDGVGVDFVALYCEYELPSGFDCQACFFSASGTSVVHRNSAVTLSHWDNGIDSYLLRFVGRDSDGNIAVMTRTVSRSLSARDISFSVNEIIRQALNSSAPDSGENLSEVLYFAVSHGTAQKVFYLLEHPFFMTFYFRNMFNAPEYIDIVGNVNKKTVVDRDSVSCAGKMRQYDQSITRTYEVKTAPLTADQVRDIEQLIGSREIRLCAGECDYEIIVTDHTIETDNSDESLPSIKFTFRFVGNRPVITESDMGALMPSSTHIFSQEFTAEFA